MARATLTALSAATAYPWHRLVRPGDWLVLAGAAVLTAASAALFWQQGAAERAVVRQEGRVVAELALTVPRTLDVAGPLGTTVIAVEHGRARVMSDPGPRQLCVRQGWLARPGEMALCAPNRVSLTIAGGKGAYDTLAY